MEKKIDVEPTVEAILKAAESANQLADELQRIAASIKKTQELSRASDAIAAIANAVPNFRMDLMVIRPLRQYQN